MFYKNNLYCINIIKFVLIGPTDQNDAPVKESEVFSSSYVYRMFIVKKLNIHVVTFLIFLDSYVDNT